MSRNFPFFSLDQTRQFLSAQMKSFSPKVFRSSRKDMMIRTLEDKLEEARKKFELVNRATNEAIRDCDLSTNNVVWNHGIATLFGYRAIGAPEHSYRHWVDNIHPADQAGVLHELNHTVENQKTNWNGIYRFRCANGTHKFIYDRVYVVYQKDKAVRMIGTMQDIDERMESMAEIERLSLVARKTDNLVTIMDGKEKIEWVNEAFVIRTGYSLQEVIGKTIRMLQGPESEPAAMDRISTRLQGRESIAEELLQYTKNGQKFWVKIIINPVFDDRSNIVRYVAVQTELTLRKEYERKITAIATDLSALIENANAVIFAVDQQLNVIEWNACAQLVTGYAKQHVRGKRISSFLFRRDQRGLMDALLEKVLAGELVSLQECPIIHQSGRLDILLISATPCKNSAGEITGVTAVGQDITELTQYRHSLEEKVRIQTEELNKALENEKELSTMITRFASIISHEFRTPLATIRMAVSQIKRHREAASSALIDANINTVITQVDHMAHLLDDVLTLGE